MAAVIPSRLYLLPEAVYPEGDHLAVALGVAAHVVGIAVPDHIVRREDIHTSAVLVPLFLLWGVFDIFEHDGFLLLDRRMQDVHGIIDGLIACFYLAVHKEAAPEALSDGGL